MPESGSSLFVPVSLSQMIFPFVFNKKNKKYTKFKSEKKVIEFN